MTMTLPGFIFLLVVAAVCGAVGRALAGGTRGGCFVSIAVGFVGAMLGPWLATQMGLSEPFTLRIAGESFPVLWSIIGGALFVAIIHLVSRR